MQIVFYIVNNNVLPLFVIILLGYMLGKKFSLDVSTLSKVYFFIFLPAFLLKNLYTVELSTDVLLVLAFLVLLLGANFLVCNLIGRLRGFSPKKRGAFSNAVMFY